MTSPMAPSTAPLAAAPSRGRQMPARDAAASQLDLIAEAGTPLRATGENLSSALLAVFGGVLLVGAAVMWQKPAEPGRMSQPSAVQHTRGVAPPTPGAEAAAAARPAAAETIAVSAPAQAAPVVAAVPATSSPDPVSTPAAVSAAPTPNTATVDAPNSASVASIEPASVAVPTVSAADDAARRERARQVAEARRKAQQLAAERAATTEAQRLQLAAQAREAERVRQQQQLAEEARDRAAAEERSRRALAAAQQQPAARSVADACAGAGGFISRQFCQARECRKADYRGDAICVQLRDNEVAQQQASAMR